MSNKTLIFSVVVVIAVTIIIITARGGGDKTPTVEGTPTPTANITTSAEPTVTSTAVTPTVSISPSVSPTIAPSTSLVVTPTVSVSAGFTDLVDTNWIWGSTQQTVGSNVYFVDPVQKSMVKRGSSATDTSAVTVVSSDNGQPILSFVVNGGYLYMVTSQDPSTKVSKFQRVNVSSGTKTRLFDFEANNFTASQFAVQKNDDTKAGFYLGITGTDGKQVPGAVYVQNYGFVWMKTFSGTSVSATISGIAPNKDGSKLLGLFSTGTVQASIDLK